MEYDLEKIRQVPIDTVLADIGLQMLKNRFVCPHPHSKPQTISVYRKNNICKCHNCDEFKGGPIDVVMYVFSCDFKDACEWISNKYGISNISNESNAPGAKIKTKPIQQKIEYMEFKHSKECRKIHLKEHMKSYKSMNEPQRLKMIYTFVYRFALKTKQNAKYGFYKKERGIEETSTYLGMIGYLGQEDMVDILTLLLKNFPKEDLVNFGILKEDGKFTFSYITKGGMLLVPSFDLYNDMVTGLMVRPTHPPKWMKEKGIKELQLSKNSIVQALPFGMNCELIKNAQTIYLTEGHMDLLSIPGNMKGAISKPAIASPGTNGIKDEMLGLLKNKEVILIFDQDMAGKKAEYGYTKVMFKDNTSVDILQKGNWEKNLKATIKKHDYSYHTSYLGLKQRLIVAGAKVKILEWDYLLGSDLNDLVINGNIEKVFS